MMVWVCMRYSVRVCMIAYIVCFTIHGVVGSLKPHQHLLSLYLAPHPPSPPTPTPTPPKKTGQQLVSANIIQDCQNFNQTIQAASTECLSSDHRARGRIICLPIQWRKQLNLDIDRLAAIIQPGNVKALRQMAHATVVEVLLYMSPSYRQRILDSLTDALNVLYHRFVHRNPAFKVCVCV